MQPVVTGQSVAEVISGWTGIPIGKMVADEINAVLNLSATLCVNVCLVKIMLSKRSRNVFELRVQASRTQNVRSVSSCLSEPPASVKLKRHSLWLNRSTAASVTLISINMSEYQEAHTVSSLKGSPPGYVGYGEGGVLTEAVRKKTIFGCAARRGRKGSSGCDGACSSKYSTRACWKMVKAARSISRTASSC